MSKKKKYTIILGIVVVNLIVVFLIKNWGNVYETWFVSKPYSLPSQSEVEKEAVVIAEKITAGDINYILDRYDLNAFFFLQQGVANWVKEDQQQEANRKLESDLIGVKKCVCTEKGTKNIVVFELTFNDGKKQEAGATLYKDKQGKIGCALFALIPEDITKRLNSSK